MYKEVLEKLKERQRKLIGLWIFNFAITALLIIFLIFSFAVGTSSSESKFSPFSLSYLNNSSGLMALIIMIMIAFVGVNIVIFILQILTFSSLKTFKPLIEDFSLSSEIDFLMKMLIAFLILDFLSIFLGITSAFLFLLVFALKIFYWFRWKKISTRF